MLISANALSRWRTDTLGIRQWTGFDARNLRLVHEHPPTLQILLKAAEHMVAEAEARPAPPIMDAAA